MLLTIPREERLAAELQRLQLDVLAGRVSSVLTAAAVPHALIKGPTTATWLYRPPRPYSDVDVLVPRSQVHEAVAALSRTDVAHPCAGRFGEGAAHSQLLMTADGHEVDLHGTLPTLVVDGRDPDRVWRTLSGRLQPFRLAEGIGPVPALAPEARAVVLALHALGAGPGEHRELEDLRRARTVLGSDGWERARQIAAQLGIVDRFTVMEAVMGGDPVASAGGEAALWLAGAGGPAIQLQRLRALPPPAIARALWRELVPSRGFMRHAFPSSSQGWIPLQRARAVRLWRIGRLLAHRRGAADG